MCVFERGKRVTGVEEREWLLFNSQEKVQTFFFDPARENTELMEE